MVEQDLPDIITSKKVIILMFFNLTLSRSFKWLKNNFKNFKKKQLLMLIDKLSFKDSYL
jgi:hypothetical protein